MTQRDQAYWLSQDEPEAIVQRDSGELFGALMFISQILSLALIALALWGSPS